MTNWLEWQSFGLVLVSTILYGRSKYWGAVLGMIGSTSFIVFGIAVGMPAAIVTNLAFIVIHIRNLNIARGEINVVSDTSE